MIKYNEIYHSKYTQMIIFIWIHTLLTTRICLDAYFMSYSIKCRVETDRSVVLKWIRHDKMKSQTIRVSRTIRVFIHIKTEKKQKTLLHKNTYALKWGLRIRFFFFPHSMICLDLDLCFFTWAEGTRKKTEKSWILLWTEHEDSKNFW